MRTTLYNVHLGGPVLGSGRCRKLRRKVNVFADPKRNVAVEQKFILQS